MQVTRDIAMNNVLCTFCRCADIATYQDFFLEACKSGDIDNLQVTIERDAEIGAGKCAASFNFLKDIFTQLLTF